MLNAIVENIQAIGPLFVCVWALTVGSVLLRPQKYANSILLMFALLVTMIFVSGFFGEQHAMFMLACFLLVMLALFLVPLMLIVNGIHVIRRESFSLAHCLSLALGLFVGVGEIATVVYVLGLSEYIAPETANPWLLLTSATVFYFSFLVLSFVVYSIFIQLLPHVMNFDYVIIHGCGLLGGDRLTKLLSNRVDKAIDIYEKCKVKPVIIPSGGQGSDERVSEAQAMKDYLLSHGVPEDHIILEDRSATTNENIAFSKAIIEGRGGGRRTALVSSNYHVYRCLRIARGVGLKCTGIGADVALYYWPSALIREFIAVFLSRSFLVWALVGYLLWVSPILVLILG